MASGEIFVSAGMISTFSAGSFPSNSSPSSESSKSSSIAFSTSSPFPRRIISLMYRSRKMITGTGFLTIIQPLASNPPLILTSFPTSRSPSTVSFPSMVTNSPRYAFLPTFTPLPIFDHISILASEQAITSPETATPSPIITVSPDIQYWTVEWFPIITSPSTVILFVSILVLSGTRRFFKICSGSGMFSLSEKTLSRIRF
ncbi:hypothetical protein SDC9_146260 [bioreactor metagenome]|uniref:Uncharacterized protein n=1 Tax=bioreactor metagenome TaxID=1076179 RepID=A0A645EB59_9ZZZZ